MRTQTEIHASLASLAFSRREYEEGWSFPTALSCVPLKDAILAGFIAGYADTLLYKGKGVILEGPSGIGKTTLSEYVASQTFEAEVLSHDDLLLSVSQNEKKVLVYRYPELERIKNSHGFTTDVIPFEEALEQYARFFTQDKGYPVRVLLSLYNSSDRNALPKRAAFPDIYQCFAGHDPDLVAAFFSENNVTVCPLDIANKTVQQTYEDVKKMLDALC